MFKAAFHIVQRPICFYFFVLNSYPFVLFLLLSPFPLPVEHVCTARSEVGEGKRRRLGLLGGLLWAGRGVGAR